MIKVIVGKHWESDHNRSRFVPAGTIIGTNGETSFRSQQQASGLFVGFTTDRLHNDQGQPVVVEEFFAILQPGEYEEI